MEKFFLSQQLRNQLFNKIFRREDLKTFSNPHIYKNRLTQHSEVRAHSYLCANAFKNQPFKMRLLKYIFVIQFVFIISFIHKLYNIKNLLLSII